MEVSLLAKALSVMNVLRDSKVEEVSYIKLRPAAGRQPHHSQIRQARLLLGQASHKNIQSQPCGLNTIVVTQLKALNLDRVGCMDIYMYIQDIGSERKSILF